MKLAIFGATGRTGHHLVEQALAQDHRLTVLARDPGRLGKQREQLTVVIGDIASPALVAQTIKGAEAVLSVLGTTRSTADFAISQGIDHILTAMKAQGLRRLIVAAGAGVRDPLDQPAGLHAVMGALVKLTAKTVYEDMAGMVEEVRASDTDWTIVRVPRLTDGPRTGQVWSGYVGKDMKQTLTRADLAAFMLRQLTDPTYVRKAPAVSGGS